MMPFEWNDEREVKPTDGVDVLVCIHGMAGSIYYSRAYSIGTYWSDDDEWEVQEFGTVPPEGVVVLGWKYIESFELEE